MLPTDFEKKFIELCIRSGVSSAAFVVRGEEFEAPVMGYHFPRNEDPLIKRARAAGLHFDLEGLQANLLAENWIPPPAIHTDGSKPLLHIPEEASSAMENIEDIPRMDGPGSSAWGGGDNEGAADRQISEDPWDM